MTFILSEQRDSEDWSSDIWQQYQAYLKANESKFTKSAFKIATSDWWYSFSTPKAPHDSRLITATLEECNTTHGRNCRLTIVLASAMGGRITLLYSGIQRYQLEMPKETWPGHGDWRYDEFSVSDDGFLVHTIEWADGPTWVITAKNLQHKYQKQVRSSP